MFQKLDDLEVYQLAEKLADDIWDLVLAWDRFPKDTVGKQIVRAADSISSNLSEGYGRYSFKENVQFCYYSKGSLEERKIGFEDHTRENFYQKKTILNK